MDPEKYDELVEKLKELWAGLGPETTPEAVEEALGDSAEGATPDEFAAALREALIESGLTEPQADGVIDQLEAQPGWGSVDPADTFQIVVNNNITKVDQSLNVAGDVHGNVVNQNTSNVANANGEGSIAGDEVAHNQVQTGDGQQVGGDSGVQNQGDNSGQQAGGSATAENVTSGDGNNVASGEASGVGDGHSTLDGVSVNDSAVAFGDGDATNQAPDTSTYTSDDSYEENTSNSFNSELRDNDSQYQSTSINSGHEEYDKPYEHEEYEGDDYHAPDTYDEHDDSYDMDHDTGVDVS